MKEKFSLSSEPEELDMLQSSDRHDDERVDEFPIGSGEKVNTASLVFDSELKAEYLDDVRLMLIARGFSEASAKAATADLPPEGEKTVKGGIIFTFTGEKEHGGPAEERMALSPDPQMWQFKQ